AAAGAFYPDLAYKPGADFEPIGLVAGIAIVVVARKDFPARDFKDFVSQIKANSQKLNMAHAGVGSTTHLGCLLLSSILGAKPTQVPFTGGAPAINALIGGQVDYMCNTIPDVVQQAQGGTIKPLAISTLERNPTLPNVPTATEAGLPEFHASAWNA